MTHTRLMKTLIYSPLISVLLLLLYIIDNCSAVTFPRGGRLVEPNGAPGAVNYGVFSNEELRVCIRSEDPLMPCLTSSMVQGIESASVMNSIHLGDGLRLVNDRDYQRPAVTGDPREVRTLLEALTLYMEPRYLHWDLSEFYPGLLMQVGPTSRGYLQFLMDKRKMVDERALSTGRLIVKRALLPVLLGVKLNVVSLVPLLVAAIIIIIKKVLVVSKFSFILAAISLFLNYRRQQGMHGGGGLFGSTSAASSSATASGQAFGGSGLGSFAGPKKVIIERPILSTNEWFREESEPEELSE